MKKLTLPIFISAFFLLVTSYTNTYAQSSDCWKEFNDQKAICDQAVSKSNSCTEADLSSPCHQDSNKLLDKCDQAGKALQACLGVDKELITVQPKNPGHLTCDEWKKLWIAGTATNCTIPVVYEKVKLKCLSSVTDTPMVPNLPVAYILDFDTDSCLPTQDDLRRLKAGLPLTDKTPASGNKSIGKSGQLDLFNINPMETWRNIQGFLAIPEGLNSLVQTAEFLSSPRDIEIQVPDPEISLDPEGKRWDFLPGYIPHESIYLGNTMRISEGTKVFAGGVNQGSDKKLLNLEKGEVEVIKNEPDMTDSEYDGIKTPNATVVSIQTHYWVSYDKKKNQTAVAVYEGKVEVKTKDGQTTQVSPNGDKPGVVVVAQKLSVTKLAIAGVVLAAIIGGTLFFLKKKRSSNRKH